MIEKFCSNHGRQLRFMRQSLRYTRKQLEISVVKWTEKRKGAISAPEKSTCVRLIESRNLFMKLTKYVMSLKGITDKTVRRHKRHHEPVKDIMDLSRAQGWRNENICKSIAKTIIVPRHPEHCLEKKS